MGMGFVANCYLNRYHLLSMVNIKTGTKIGTKNSMVPDEIY